jgi:hypothetical protein
MNHYPKISLLGIFAFLFVVSSDIYAGEWLTKRQAYNLLSGNTITGFYMAESTSQAMMLKRVDIKMKFHADGSAEQTIDRPGPTKGRYTEKGEWYLNRKGALCMSSESANKRKCGRLRPIADGKYELVRKGKTIVFEEIIPGT